MISGLRLSRLLLTSASLVTLSVVGIARATAAGQVVTKPGHVPVNINNDRDWVIVDNSDISTFTNNSNISDGYDPANPDAVSRALALHVRSNSKISQLVNAAAGNITAIEGTSAGNGLSTAHATASALVIDGIVPSVVNNGTIRALAVAHDTNTYFDPTPSADAFAVGYRSRNGALPTSVNDLVNNGTIAARAKSFAHNSYFGSAEASARAIGVSQSATHSGPATKTAVSLTNGGIIKALATATAQGFSYSNGSAEVVARARAFAIGVGQEASSGTDSSAIVANNGSIIAQASAKAFASYDIALATYAGATGVGQRVFGNGVGSAALAKVTNGGLIQAKASAVARVLSPVSDGTYELAVAFDHAGGVRQEVGNATSAKAIVDNTGSILAVGNAFASAARTYAFAVGGASGVSQSANADGSNRASVFVGNSGSIVARSNVTAQAGLLSPGNRDFALAFAFAEGVLQRAHRGETSLARTNNSGLISGRADALAKAAGFFFNPFSHGAFAAAEAVGVFQSASATNGPGSFARSWTTNSGVIKGLAHAHAQATTYAVADAAAGGVRQIARDAVTARAILNNSGTIIANASATADPLGLALVSAGPGSNLLHDAFARVTYLTGVAQSARGDGPGAALANLANSGQILVTGKARAVSGSGSYAFAGVSALGVAQGADNAGSVEADLANSGSILVVADARAFAPSHTYARATANATGVSQTAFGIGDGSNAAARLTNSGVVKASAVAVATAMHQFVSYGVDASATATGISQRVQNAVNGIDDVVNSGSIAAVAKATAQGGNARAFADAIGVDQQLESSLTGSAKARLRNKAAGTIVAHAVAKAVSTGGRARASASASGYDVRNGGEAPPVPITLDAVNNGLIAAVAQATASGGGFNQARAIARGIGVYNPGGTVDGSIVNNGTVFASAVANGSHGFASAIGIFDPSANNNTHILNTGLIKAYAQGTDPHATAIGIAGSGKFAEVGDAAPSKTVITNDGDLWAGISTDGGKTVLWGNAINTVNAGGDGPAPNEVAINLIDATPSHIFGNILTTGPINVSHGATFLDGQINPGGPLQGTLDIDATGKLVFEATDPVNGASGAWVATYTNHVNGTLGIELTPNTNPSITPKMHYPHIFADTANLRGTLFAGFTPGIYADHLVYDNVIDANVRNGVFDKVLDNSALLQTHARYDAGNNVDLVVNRLAFSGVQGLSGNQKAVGQSLDALFGSLGTGAFSGIVGDLFALDNAGYAQALNALSGAEYAQLDQSVLWSTGQLNSTITDRMDCGANWAASASGMEDKRCFVPGKTQVWARIHGSWNNNGGDSNAPGYDETQMGVYGGADYALTNNWFFGLAGGYFTSDMGFDNWTGMGGSSIDYQGLQAALYGGYDDGAWYARGIGSFGLYNGDSHRLFGLITTPIDPSGSFDASVESFYGELGRRYALMPHTTVTPFLGVSVAHSDINGFTESDPNGSGAALTVSDASGDSLASVLGARVTSQWGAWKPELSVAWQHEFLDTVQTVHNAFASAPGAPGFDVTSSDPGRDWALVSVGSTYTFNPSSEFVLKYDGRFASGYTSHSLVARWETHF